MTRWEGILDLARRLDVRVRAGGAVDPSDVRRLTTAILEFQEAISTALPRDSAPTSIRQRP